MADQGPLQRVDIDGRGTLIKMTPQKAKEYVAANPGATITGQRPDGDVPSDNEQAATESLERAVKEEPKANKGR